MTDENWWRGAVIYQIYPRSFADSNNDGIGDMKGIASKMGYIASLGVDAIWISPFYKSPMKDFGYDVADYRKVDGVFGSNEDFDEMLEAAHKNNIKVMIDFVPSHTSDKHAWFIESRASKDNPKSDWYVWADPKDDGTPPNNWLSIFGGPAWQWDSRRKQYYLHNFLVEQPDLNYHNPEVSEAILGEMDFWLNKGVDGFRLDVINMCYHDKELRDNPGRGAENLPKGQDGSNPFYFQNHMYNRTRPEMFPFLKRLRTLMNSYPARTTVGEISSEDPTPVATEYVKGKEHLHMAYTFDLLENIPLTAGYVRKVINRMESLIEDGQPCWSFSNHDVIRARTRWGGESVSDDFVFMLHALLLSLRGTVYIYQGEELGLPDADVPFDKLQDPFGIEFWPEFKGRDGCRTPIPWKHDEENAGFSKVEPWLPVPENHQNIAVDVQEEDKDSSLNRFRRLIAWRKLNPVLINGSIEMLETEEPVIAFIRENEEEKILAVFNYSSVEASFEYENVEEIKGHGLDFAEIKADKIELGPYGVFFGKIAEKV